VFLPIYYTIEDENQPGVEKPGEILIDTKLKSSWIVNTGELNFNTKGHADYPPG